MARLSSDIHSTNPFHITSRSHNRERFLLPLPELWVILCSHLNFVRFAFHLRIHAFVLMPNHIHLLATAPKGNMSEAMLYFFRGASKIINFEAHRINQVWGNRFHRCEIRHFNYFLNAYKYIYQNPLRANLVSRAEDYPFSTLHSHTGQAHPLLIPDDESFFDIGIGSNLDWLNARPTDKEIAAIRKALQKNVFQFPKRIRSETKRILTHHI